MLANNNKVIVNKMSMRMFKANPLRNVFAVLGIILTTTLLTSILTIGLTFYQTTQRYDIISTTGLNADGFIQVTTDQYEKLSLQQEIKSIGFSTLASEQVVQNESLLNDNIIVESTDDEIIYEMKGIVPYMGTFPNSSTDILVPNWLLSVLKLDEKVNQEVTLSLFIDNELKEITFNICGIYEPINGRELGQNVVFVHPSFISNSQTLGTAYLTIRGLTANTDSDEAKLVLEKLANKVGSDQYQLHSKYEETMGAPIPMDQIFAVLFGVFILMFSGYLMIYNVFYISIVKDIKFYGLLRTIGTSAKQLKSILMRQALWLALIGIPFGLGVGYLIGIYLIPQVLGMTYVGRFLVISDSPVIFIGAILFSLLTVFISVFKPAKLATSISPIEATRYQVTNAEINVKKEKRQAKVVSPKMMAWSNLMRSKKKIILSILSISLSAVAFIFALCIFMGLDPLAHANRQMTYDIEITSQGHDSPVVTPINEQLIQEVSALSFVNSVIPYKKAMTYQTDSEMFISNGEIVNEGLIKEEFDQYPDPEENWTQFNYNEDKENILLDITSASSKQLTHDLSRLTLLDGEIDEQLFESGESVIFMRHYEDGVIKAGDELTLTFVTRDETGKESKIQKILTVMAVVGYPKDGYVAHQVGHLTISETLFNELYPNMPISTLGLTINSDMDAEKADQEIRETLVDYPELSMLSKYYYLDGISNMKVMFTTTGLVVSFLLGLIGILNVANTIITNLYSRTLEFAMLESIGMTKKQLKRMLQFEGLYYTFLSLVVIIPLGLCATLLAPRVLPLYGGLRVDIYLISVLIIMLIILMLMISVPLVVYRFISKASLVERLRYME